MNDKLDTKNYILYLLNKLPVKVDLYKINKIAFLIEFAYIYKFGENLTNTKYAALPKGPVINDYKTLFNSLEDEGKIKVEGIYLRVLEDPQFAPKSSVKDFIDSLVEKYLNFDSRDLVAITHSLDSYIITSKNETSFGAIIDKDLANLDTYFSENIEFNDEETPVNEDDLPVFRKDELVNYEMG